MFILCGTITYIKQVLVATKNSILLIISQSSRIVCITAWFFQTCRYFVRFVVSLFYVYYLWVKFVWDKNRYEEMKSRASFVYKRMLFQLIECFSYFIFQFQSNRLVRSVYLMAYNQLLLFASLALSFSFTLWLTSAQVYLSVFDECEMDGNQRGIRK